MSDAELMDFAERFLERWPVRDLDAAALLPVLQTGTVSPLLAGEILCREGSPANAWYFLLQGELRVTREPGPTTLARIEAPAVVGHMAVIDHAPRSATVRASTPCRVLMMDTRTHDRLVGDPGPAGAAHRRLLLASLVRQERAGNQHLARVAEGEGPWGASLGLRLRDLLSIFSGRDTELGSS